MRQPVLLNLKGYKIMDQRFIYHENLSSIHIGTEAPRAYFIPFDREDACDNVKRGASPYFKSLCGEWDFGFYKNSTLVPVDLFRAELPDKMPVPYSWQCALGKGYDTPNYTNINYPFPCNPPYIPEENPCGLYRRTFHVHKPAGKSLYLNFEGVDSCFYLYLNGAFVGYSSVSHMTSEFHVTDYLCEGENEIVVLVFKWNCCSYLEDQDKWRYSGIFRDCYLLTRDVAHIRDISVKAKLDETFTKGLLTADLDLSADIPVSYRLLSPAGEVVSDGEFTDRKIAVNVDGPVLWNDEEPMLYHLVLHAGNEYISLQVGFRRIDIKGRVFYLNGQKIKCRGVNRHDSHPRLGSATPLEHIVNDLKIMKRHNVNAIRTSHYPNDPRLVELCDRYGFYLIDEADLETHGTEVDNRYEQLAHKKEWKDAFVDRMARMYERDKTTRVF